MAISVTLSRTPTEVLINQEVNCFLTITNLSASAANQVIAARPFVTFTGGANTVPACALGVIDLGPGAVTIVPPSGVISFRFDLVFFAPSTGPIGDGTGTYSIGAVITTADGVNTSPTPATVTVDPLPLPVTQQ